MKRTSNAQWTGNLKGGKGTISTQSKSLDQMPYSFGTRVGDGVGTNPEELLGAAHAGCFTMALSATLEQAGFVAGSLSTKATVELDVATLTITTIHLDLTATPIEGLNAEQFLAFANGAKENCPLSKALKAVSIVLTVNY